MTTILPILFVQDDEADEILSMLTNIKGCVIYGPTEESVKRTVEHLVQWDQGEDEFATVERLQAPVGNERRLEFGGYVITYNHGPAYVSFDRVVG